MTRPKIYKRICFRPKAYYFKPRGIPMLKLEEIVLDKEELEAIKLNDFDDLNQIEAAEKMKISQSTFQRILSSARGKIAEAIIKGKALRIEK
ncbi:MAG: DUF134 domain-containing protein [Candidatus Moranbacteria bacterium]|nr:DUF134 domain-containing protein [Candidatus Moranbacteria bacterium]